MKSILFSAGAVVALAGCASTGQPTAWGKAGVSRIDYGTDIGLCTGQASQRDAGSGVNTAGGVSGANNAPVMDTPGRGTQRGENGGPPSQTQAARSDSLPAGGTYSGTTSSDFAQRAATQQRLQEMNAKRIRAEAFKGCLIGKGYSEFKLTPEQRAHLASLKEGSNEQLEYLYRIGSDPASTSGGK